jgi:hypothetical protein
MPEIVSASRRTDLPAYHARWFANRMRAGYCHWIHPFTGAVRRVSLRAEDVIAFVFWTRHPGPLMPFLPELVERGTPFLFQYTITAEGAPVESHGPTLAAQIGRFAELSRRYGADAVLWRYDPVLLSDDHAPEIHIARFADLAARLEGMTRRCTFSFVDFYGKTVRNLARVEAVTGMSFHRPSSEEKRVLARNLAEIAGERGMELLSCCDESLVGEGIGRSRCVDPIAVARVAGGEPPELPPRPTRKDCGCVRSIDIGTYDTCGFGCAYCYAVTSRAAALRRLAGADPDDTVLWRPPSLRGVDLAEREVGEG